MELNANGVPTQWNGNDWDYYKTLMLNVFVENELDEIVSGNVSPQESWTVGQSLDYKKNQAR